MSATPEPDDLATRLLARPGRVVAAAALVVTAALAVAWGRLEVSADRSALLGRQHAFNRQFAALQEEFADVDAVVALVSAPTRPRAREVGAELARRALAREAEVEGAFWGVSDEALRGQALLFLSPAERAELEARLAEAVEPLRELRRAGPGAMLALAARRAREATPSPSTPSSSDASASAGFELLVPIVDGALGALERGEAYAPLWEALAPAGVRERDGHVWAGERLVVLLQPRRGARPADAVQAIREVVAEVRAAHPDATVGLTGGPVLEVDETATFVRDGARTTAASFVLVTALLVLAFNRLLGPLLAFGAQTWAIAVTLGVAGLWPGHLNLLTAAFCALLAGLGVGHAIHLLARYDEARSFGLRGGADAAAHALREGARPIAAGALATALGFMATLLAEVEGIREFGFLAGAGVLVSLAASLALLPALLVLLDRKSSPSPRPGVKGDVRRPRLGWARSPFAAALDRAVERSPGALLVGALLVAGVGLAHAFGVEPGAVEGEPPRRRLRWQGDLLRLQDEALESVRLARDLLEDRGVTGLFGAVVVDDEASLRRVEAAVRALPTVARTESLLDVVPADQPAALASLARVRESLRALRAPGGAGQAPIDFAIAPGAEALSAALEPFSRGALERGRAGDAELLLGLQERLERLAAAPRAPPARQAALAAWSSALVADLDQALARLDLECQARPIGTQDLPAEVRGRFVGRSGKLLLRIYPAVDAWEPAHLDRFLTEVRSVVPDVGGFPVQLREADRLLVRGAARVSLVALCFVACAFAIWFRDVLTPLLGSFALLVGASWSIGLAAIVGLELNPANLLGLPITLGVGAAAVLHILDRDRQARAAPSLGPPRVVATSAGRAVILSSLAVLASFTALACAEHRGLASLGASVALGVIGALVAALVVAPALARLRAGRWPAPPLEGKPGPKLGPDGAPRGQEP